MVRPGQAVVLDFMNRMGRLRYQHMPNTKSSSVNDHRVRIWAGSKMDEADDGYHLVELTMFDVSGHSVTSALFDAALRIINYA